MELFRRKENEQKFDALLDMLQRMVSLQETNQQELRAALGNPNGTRREGERRGYNNGHESSSNSHTPLPRPSKPMFLVPPPLLEEDEVIDELDEWFATYSNKFEGFMAAVSFDNYLNIVGKSVVEAKKEKKKPLLHQKVTIPSFNGQDGLIARAWLQKLQTYFTLEPISEADAVQIATLHLEGSAYSWWHHGLVTQGHCDIDTSDEFCVRVLNRFERRNVEKTKIVHQKEELEVICAGNSEVVLTIEKEEEGQTENFEREYNEDISTLEHGSSCMIDCIQICDRDVTLSHEVCLKETQNTSFCTLFGNEINEVHNNCIGEFSVSDSLSGVRRDFQIEPFGDLIPCNKAMKNIKISFGNYEGDEQFFVFPLGGVPHMVLRVQWIWSLRDYVTNYQKLELKFVLDGKGMVLQGIKENTSKDACKILEVSYKYMEGGQLLDISCEGKFTSTMVPSNKMLIFLMWMHRRRCKTLPTWNVAEKDTFSWSYVVSFDLVLWLSLVYTLLILFWDLELTFVTLYVENIAQNSHLMATYESDKEIRKIAIGNVDNRYTCHLTIPHDILSHLDSWDSQQKCIITERIQGIIVSLLMKFWNSKKGTNSTLYWDTCAYLEHGLKDKWDEWVALLVEP